MNRECNKCHKNFPLTAEFFHRNKTCVAGLLYTCKTCERQRKQDQYDRKCSTLEGILLSAIKSARNRKGKVFNLTLNNLIKQYEKQKGLCFYTDEVLALKSREENSISIDRMDSSKGYIPDNIVLCCSVINRLKETLSVDRFKYWCKLVAKKI